MKEFHKEHWNFTLYEDTDGSLLLDVVCGTVAVYEVRHKLKPEEAEKYHKEGIEYIKKLASDIQYNPSKYQE